MTWGRNKDLQLGKGLFGDNSAPEPFEVEITTGQATTSASDSHKGIGWRECRAGDEISVCLSHNGTLYLAGGWLFSQFGRVPGTLFVFQRPRFVPMQMWDRTIPWPTMTSVQVRQGLVVAVMQGERRLF